MPEDANLNGGAPSGTLGRHVEQLAERFDAAWQAGRRPRIEEFLGDETLARNPAGLRQVLLELVRLDLAWRWKGPPAETLSSRMASEKTDGGTGVFFPSRPKLEDYCRAYPTLGPLDGLPDELIVAEYEARRRHGDEPSHAHYRDRFPGKAEGLVELLRQADLALASTLGKQALGETVALPAGAGLDLRPITRERFLENLAESGLMTGDEAAALLESLPPDATTVKEPTDGRALAVRLVRAGRLTPYQAEQLCRGETGMLAFDEYTVLARLGAGGMGEVLKAEHRSMGRLVAVKVLAPKLVDSPDAVRRFQREVRAAARLIHPNIVAAFDAREHAGRHCLVMEYVEGYDLGQIVKRQGALPVAEAVEYVIQAARGLQFAHEHGIVHRDIKPANLLLQSPSSSSSKTAGSSRQKAIIKILDMGLARLDDAAGGDEDDQLTGSSQMMGTCDYMAPEQAVDTHNVDHRADIYALGCTLYRLVTGKRPYTGCTPVQVLMAHREAPIPSLREGRDDVSPQLDAVYRRMVAKRPEDRQRSMAEVIEQLSACCVPEEAEQGPSDIALKAFLHGVAVESSTGVSHGPAAPSRSAPSPAPAASSGLSTAGGSTLAPAAPRARSLRPYLLIGGMVMVAVVLAGLLAAVLWPAKPAGSGLGVLALEGPLDQVQVAARHEKESEVRFLKPDAQGRIELREGAYRLALARGHEQYRLVPKSVTIAPGKRVTVQIQENVAPPPAIAPFGAAQAKNHQQAWADYLGVPVEMKNSIGMKFVLIPPGEFMMGSTEEEVAQLLKEAKERQDDGYYVNPLPSEAPRHRVRITRPFYLGLYEVTQAEYQRVMGANPSYFSAEGEAADRVAGLDTSRHAVEAVSWNNATAFCEKLSTMSEERREGRIYVLPTEAQWEYACRAGTATKWNCGDDGGVLTDYAWFGTNSGGRTNEVGQKKPNAFGLFDMHGNVSEMCADWFGNDYYTASPADDPQGPVSGSFRVNRGGGWRTHTPRHFRSAARVGRNSPGDRGFSTGFRVVCEIPQKAESGKPEVAVEESKADSRPSVASPPAEETPRPGATADAPAPATPWNLPPGSPPPAVAPFDAATARKHQEAWAAHLGKPLEMENSIGMKFVLIPPGEFMMGSTEEEVAQLQKEAKERQDSQWYFDRLPSEAPRHRVRITRPFYLGLHEVTQAEYAQLMGVNPSAFSTEGEEAAKVTGLDTSRHPVEAVSWDDAKAFCEKLSAMPEEHTAGRIYVLPTEAQWEYACRAGTATKWSCGDDEVVLRDYAWYSTNSDGRTRGVGGRKPNAFGLFDMHGNVWEWCAEWFDENYYAASPVDDPQGPASGSGRVRRGGGWNSTAWSCRSAGRGGSTPDDRYSHRGFRLALVPVEAETAKPEARVEGPTVDSRPSTADPPAKETPHVSTDAEAAAPATPWTLPPGSPAPAVAPFDAVQAKKHQEAWAAHLGKPLEMENSIGMKFILIPPGEFMMGSTEEEVEQLLKEAKERQESQWYIGQLPSESPRHRVRITRPFYLGLYEVTQAEYQRMMGVNPSYFSAQGKGADNVAGLDTSRHPVEQVFWNDAKAFCEKLSAMPEERTSGRVYVLPTEAQWEYTCRAGTVTKWSCGDDGGMLRDYAWFSTNFW